MNPDDLLPLIIVPLLFISLATVAALAISHRTRYLMQQRDMLNKERLMALEKGVNLPLLEAPKNQQASSSLKTGMITLATGLGIGFMGYVKGGDVVWAAGVLIGLIGIAQLAYWHLGGRKEWEARVQWEQAVGESYLRYLHELTAKVQRSQND